MSFTHKIHWAFNATHAASSEASGQAEIWARQAGLPEALTLRLVLVIEELFTNTIKHGYCEESNRQVVISLDLQDGLAVLDYRDQAPPFDPIGTVVQLPADRAPSEVGGMGLRLIQSLGLQAQYARENGWNIVHLKIGANNSGPSLTDLNRHTQRKNKD